MQQPLDRRNFLRRSAAYTGGTLLAPSLAGLIACNDTTGITAPAAAPSLKKARKGAGGYGDLVPAPNGLPFLIPAGFQLKEISRAGAPLAGARSGTVPNALDGMGAFRAPGNRVRLVRNHEIRDAAAAAQPMGSKPYDAKGGGCCTTLTVEVDKKSGEPTVVDEFVSISRTLVNCAGGETPWGSWLTCEETVEGVTNARGVATGRLQNHGYVFEVPADATSEVEAVPYREMGRFARLEGCWYGDHSVFFNATSGGAVGAGQVWQYIPRNPNEGELVLVFESPSPAVLDAPDNICVSPRGGLVICEDGGGTQFLRGLTQQGQIFDFVRAADPVDATEFAGACFSPDGETMFFNTQGSTSRTGTERGGTFAIWGDWQAGAL